MMINGLEAGIIEIALFFYIANYSYNCFNFDTIPKYIFFWLAFTVLTGIYELAYICNHKKSIQISKNFLKNKTNVWYSEYNLSIIIPTTLSIKFYGEYGAHADREYMTKKDYWSLLIEGSHCLFCGSFALIALTSFHNNQKDQYYLTVALSMGTQLMNSILYMGEYFIQVKTKTSINYNSKSFPSGILLIDRPFMYINIFWTLMPILILNHYIKILS